MAIYALQFSSVSRRAGASAVRHAAYRAGERLRDERRGRTHDFSGKADVVHREILAPPCAPGWVRDRTELWNRVETRERRWDARLAHEVYVAIPREIPPSRWEAAVQDFVQNHFVARGMVADVALHAPKARDGGEHPHAHILLTTRSLEGDGFGLKEPAWNHPREVGAMRAAWERCANRALVRAGSLERVDSRSLAEQRSEAEAKLERAIERVDGATARRLTGLVAALEREPEPPLGRAASGMEKKGQRSRQGERVRAVREQNAREAGTRLQERMRETERRLARRRHQIRIERLQERFMGVLGRQAARTPPTRIRLQEPDRGRALPERTECEPDPALRNVLDKLRDPLHQRDTLSAEESLRSREQIGARLEEIVRSRPGGVLARSGERERQARMDRAREQDFERGR